MSNQTIKYSEKLFTGYMMFILCLCFCGIASLMMFSGACGLSNDIVDLNPCKDDRSMKYRVADPDDRVFAAEKVYKLDILDTDNSRSRVYVSRDEELHMKFVSGLCLRPIIFPAMGLSVDVVMTNYSCYQITQIFLEFPKDDAQSQ